MNRNQWEAEAIARANGWRGGFAGEMERRARDRRAERAAADFERERREHVRRASDRRAADNAACNEWESRFHAARLSLSA